MKNYQTDKNKNEQSNILTNVIRYADFPCAGGVYCRVVAMF